ncbi:MAG: hypothetical protein IKY98_05410, partial [Alphaproteobacteria bacterium]|nr:hypothetical protein [Alphaproteobacteria bacterium]
LKTTQNQSLFKIAVQFAKPEAILILVRAGLDLWQAEQSEKLLDEAVRLNKPYAVAMIRNCLVEQGIDFDKYYAHLTACQQVSQNNADMVAALQGVLAQPSRPKAQIELSSKTLSEKIADLSPLKKERFRVIVADIFLQSNLSNKPTEKIILKQKKGFWEGIMQNVRAFFRD